MHDDLNKAEYRWRNRSLFRKQRRRLWGRLVVWVLVVTGAVTWAVYRQEPITAWIAKTFGMPG